MSRRSFVALACALLLLVVLQRTCGGDGGNVRFFSDSPSHRPSPAARGSDGYPVVAVVDGDTVNVRVDGTVEPVRLIGIDAPEPRTPGRAAQCYGPEASAGAEALLQGKTVRLEFDASQGRRDRYDRLLAYVWVGHTLVNERLVRQGYAREFTFDEPYRYRVLFRAAEAEARAAGRGLWAADTCGGSR